MSSSIERRVDSCIHWNKGILVGSVEVNLLSYHYRADKSTILRSVEAEIITFLQKDAAIF